MGAIISKAANGVGAVLGNAFVAPIKTIFGGSCEGVCSGTWDFACFIEHLCVSNIVRLLMVLGLCYLKKKAADEPIILHPLRLVPKDAKKEVFFLEHNNPKDSVEKDWDVPDRDFQLNFSTIEYKLLYFRTFCIFLGERSSSACYASELLFELSIKHNAFMGFKY